MAVSAKEDININQAVETIISWSTNRNKPIDASELPGKLDAPEPSVYAHTDSFKMAEAHSREKAEANIKTCLAEIAKDIQAAGCKLIGHLKAIIKTPKGGYLMVSITSFDEEAQIKGRLPATIQEFDITVNTIAYDIDKEKLKEIVCRNINKCSVHQRCE